MKKIFTLIATALMAVGANAQESWLVDAETVPGDIAGFDYKATASVKLNLADSEYGNVGSLNTEDGDYRFDVFTHYFSGKNNPKDATGKTNFTHTNHTLPTQGCYYIFKPSVAGSIEAGIVLNSAKPFYISDGDGTALSDFDIKDNNGSVVALDANCQTASKVYGKVTFNVEAGKAYYVLCTGSKLGFAGFKFNTTAATINPATTAACKEAIDAANPNNQGGDPDPQPSGDEEVVGVPTQDKGTVSGKSYTAGVNGEFTASTSGDYTKIRTGNSGNTITLNVNSGYAITGVKLEGYSNNNSTEADRSIILTGINVDGSETSVLASPVTLPGGTAGQTPATAEAKGFEAKQKVVFAFDNSKIVDKDTDSNGKNKQIFAKITVTFKEGTTGISTVKNETINLNAPAYNLAGQKVAEGYKGVVIQNGRKVVK